MNYFGSLCRSRFYWRRNLHPKSVGNDRKAFRRQVISSCRKLCIVSLEHAQGDSVALLDAEVAWFSKLNVINEAQLRVEKETWRLHRIYSKVELMVVLVLVRIFAILKTTAIESGQLKFAFDNQLLAR